MIKKWSAVGIILLFVGISIISSTAQDTKKPLPTSDGKWWYVGGELLAVNPDGTERWRSGSICNEGIISSPAIAEDGTVYVGSLHDYEIFNGGFISRGYLHAFGSGDVKKIEIEKPKRGKLYFFGNEILDTLTGRTFIVGPIDIKINTFSPNELENNVNIYIDFQLQYSSNNSSFV